MRRRGDARHRRVHSHGRRVSFVDGQAVPRLVGPVHVERGLGWALGTLFPEFDELARPIKRRINHAAVATPPISFRPALLAGLSRAIAHPAVLDAIRDETVLQGQKAFERLCEEARIDAHATGKSHPT